MCGEKSNIIPIIPMSMPDPRFYLMVMGIDLIEKKDMNKERYNQIVDEVYEKYVESWEYAKTLQRQHSTEEEYQQYLKEIHVLSQEEFISKCKTEEMCGLMISERELSLEERFNLRYPGGNFSVFQKNYPNTHKRNNPNDLLDVFNIPTKLITITYNNETIEFYE